MGWIVLADIPPIMQIMGQMYKNIIGRDYIVNYGISTNGP